MFNIITNSYNFKRYSEYAKSRGLVRDVCILESLDQNPGLDNINDYIKVVQKSELWFHLRALASSTASAVGKLIKGTTQYPSFNQITDLWKDKILDVPFNKTHTMKGHMKWGVDYEDPALVHFTVNNNLTVAQVGTIYLPMTSIIEMMENFLPAEDISVIQTLVDKFPSIKDEHFLVSPDGLVGKKDDGSYSDLPSDLVGMLEIKCISPFHHVENKDGTLSWVDDMEKRQWYHAGEIPYVYIIQICMQALSGIHRFNMNETHIMWFVRWSPWGFSEFNIEFGHLVKMGIISAILYLTLKQRIITIDDLPFQYVNYEKPLVELLNKYYNIIIDSMNHRYIDHINLYPEFHMYREVTENFKFKVS
uniref:YqaJ viral recombinase domain-containing protein n=1 Tax=viral metagenome TaxID=1070528 RepID=A0A6C0J4D3_9ZZZZ